MQIDVEHTILVCSELWELITSVRELLEAVKRSDGLELTDIQKKFLKDELHNIKKLLGDKVKEL